MTNFNIHENLTSQFMETGMTENNDFNYQY